MVPLLLKTFSARFNPRSPVRERPVAIGYKAKAKAFQSTLPREGATIKFKCDN